MAWLHRGLPMRVALSIALATGVLVATSLTASAQGVPKITTPEQKKAAADAAHACMARAPAIPRADYQVRLVEGRVVVFTTDANGARAKGCAREANNTALPGEKLD
jgi:hypothetical protein